MLLVHQADVSGLEPADEVNVLQLLNGRIDHRGALSIEADTVLTMKVTPQLESRDVIPQTEPHRFTGEAGFRVLHTMDVGAGMPAVTDAGASVGASTFNAHPGNVSMVRFEAGARTHWHSHS